MKRYISKDAVLAEIEKLVDKGKYNEEYDCAYRDGTNAALHILKKRLGTLEVKDVGPRLTWEDISILRQIMFDYNRQVRNEMSIPNNEDYCKEVLKRFKAQNGEKI